MRCSPGLLFSLVIVAPTVALSSKVFYADQPTGSPGSILSVGLDGTSPDTVVTYPGTPNLRGVAWHRNSGRIYLLDNAAKMIRSILPNGASQLDITPIDAALLGSDLEVDEGTGKIFWSETNTGSSLDGDGFIRTANLDGTGVTTVVGAGPGSESPYFIFVDRPGGFVYWGVLQSLVSQNGSTTFRRSSFAGVIDPTFAITTQTRSRDLAVDPTTSIAYWCDRQAGAIFRRPLSGVNNEIVISGMNAPHGIAIDVQARKVYWADTGQRGSGPTQTSARRVARCNFDGAEYENLSASNGFNEPWDLTLDLSCPTYADWRARFFSVETPLRNAMDDADDDGQENVFEYAFDTHPRDGGEMGGPTPVGKGIEFPRRRVSPLTYRVEVSTDLATWRYNGDGSGQVWTVEDSVVPIDAEMDLVEIAPAAAMANELQLYYRIRISTAEGAAPLAFATSTTLQKAKAKRMKAPRSQKLRRDFWR
jgi:hypothetical protein